MSKPSDFFVGIIDLFAVFLPGSVLFFVLYQEYTFFLNNIAVVSSNQSWVVFLFFSYLIGHIVFGIGSKLDILYDFHRARKNPYNNQSAYQCATTIKNKFLTDLEQESFNTYKWSTAILTIDYPEAMREVNRLVADSKFFRSLVVIIPVIAIVFLERGHYFHAMIVSLFVIPCYMRYYDRRLKPKSTHRT